MAKGLRVVTDAERVRPKSVKEAVDSGNLRDLLAALRIKAAAAIESPGCSATAVAALSRRLVEMTREIEALDAVAEGDPVGEAAATPDEPFDGRV